MDHIQDKMNQMIKEQEILDLIRNLIKIPSHWAQSEREKPISNYLKSLFESEGIEVYLQEVIDGRSNVIATLHGTSNGPSLMFNGHIDTVPPFGMEKPFDAELRGNRLYGRGSVDMKSGIGTMAFALIMLKRMGIKLKGDVVFAGVIDEDAAGSAGARYIVENGPITDYAIVTEPTKFLPVVAHKGMEDFEIVFTGKSVHSSVPQKGVNAICAAAHFVQELEQVLIPRYEKMRHPLLGSPTINVGLIKGSAQANEPFLVGESDTFAGIVPDVCRVYLDIRYIPGQTIEQMQNEIEKIAEKVVLQRSGVSAKVNYIPRPRPALDLEVDHTLVKTVQESIYEVTGQRPAPVGETFWADSGLLSGLARIPTIMFGPGDISAAHSDNEFIEIDRLADAVKVYMLSAIKLCGYDN